MKSSSPTFFIIPGFKQKSSDTNFRWLISYVKKKGFNVILVPIKWNYRVMSDYIEDFKKYYLAHKSITNYILGFSYGAVIAFSSANELSPNKIFLCSLSPDFKEDISSMKAWVKKIVGTKRLKDTRARSAKSIAQNLNVPSIIFYGEKEGRHYPQLKTRCEETAGLAKNSKLVIVPHAPHKIDHPKYVEAVRNQLEIL